MDQPTPGTTAVHVRGEDPLGRQLVWTQSLMIVLGGADRAATRDVSLRHDGGSTTTLTSDLFPDGPRWVLPTGGGLGYGDFVLPADMLGRLADDLPLIIDPLTRGAATVTLWESMLEGRLRPDDMRAALMASVLVERDELNLARQLGYLQSLFWRFTSQDQRPEVAGALYPLLRQGLADATGTSRKSVWFSAIRNTALTGDAVEWLTQVWRKDVAIEDLPFSENDQAELAMELALRGVDVLDEQEARLQNADRKARFVFVRPAVAADLAARDALFERLTHVEYRQREAWVLEAMNYLHHPLRAHEVAHQVIPALDLVLEIRNTGDIFFPKRWADAVLGGHHSRATADAVRAFINGLPRTYPQRLRWVLEASADPLFRAAR